MSAKTIISPPPARSNEGTLTEAFLEAFAIPTPTVDNRLIEPVALTGAGKVTVSLPESGEATILALTDLFKSANLAAIHQQAGPKEADEPLNEYFGKGGPGDASS